jgi:hypothetical protein
VLKSFLIRDFDSPWRYELLERSGDGNLQKNEVSKEPVSSRAIGRGV